MAGRSLNKVQLIGNLGRDPEIRFTPSGTAVVNFTMATSDSWTDRDGNSQDRTEWHRIVAFGKLAEIINQYLSKGRRVYIEGRLQTRSWEDKDGNKRNTTEVVATEMIMLDNRGDSNEGGASQARNGGHAEAPPPDDYGPDDEIPF